MSDIYKFASANPFETVIIVSIIAGAIIRLVPWSRKRSDDWDDWT